VGQAPSMKLILHARQRGRVDHEDLLVGRGCERDGVHRAVAQNEAPARTVVIGRPVVRRSRGVPRRENSEADCREGRSRLRECGWSGCRRRAHEPHISRIGRDVARRIGCHRLGRDGNRLRYRDRSRGAAHHRHDDAHLLHVARDGRTVDETCQDVTAVRPENLQARVHHAVCRHRPIARHGRVRRVAVGTFCGAADWDRRKPDALDRDPTRDLREHLLHGLLKRLLGRRVGPGDQRLRHRDVDAVVPRLPQCPEALRCPWLAT